MDGSSGGRARTRYVRAAWRRKQLEYAFVCSLADALQTLPAYPDVLPALTRLRRLGVPLAVRAVLDDVLSVEAVRVYKPGSARLHLGDGALHLRAAPGGGAIVRAWSPRR